VATAGPHDGPVVVLLHGWPQHWWMWRHQLPALAADGHRVLALDLRGFGWSAAPASGYTKDQFAADMSAALDALGVGRFAIAGHDWGGWTAQLLALRAPERVTRMAVLNIAPVFRGMGGTLPHAWRLTYQLPLAAPLLGPRVQRLATSRLPGVARADAAVYAERFRDPARARAGAEVYRASLAHDLPAVAAGRYDAGRLRAPLLVLHGLGDPVVRRSMVEGFRRHADDLRIEYVEGTGHFIVDERPDLVNERLLAHFRS